MYQIFVRSVRQLAVAARVRRGLSGNMAFSPRRQFSDQAQGYQHILASTPKTGVAQITLNRPKALNALSTALFVELNDALRKFDEEENIGVIILTGSEKAFAAGADIKEMKDLTFAKAYGTNFIEMWSTTITNLNKPTIAAVSGYALGGGCELAMMADIIYCTENAVFGQPEIKLGVIPGAGGSQRLTRAIGKAKAMEIILTGKTFSGIEAEKWGLAARSFASQGDMMEAAVSTAETIAGYGRLAVKAAKDVVNQSQESVLAEGVKYERRVFHSLFGSKDQKIGMSAFAEKRIPEWSNE